MAWSSSLVKKLAVAVAVIAAAGLLAFIISRVTNDGKAGNAEYTGLTRPGDEFSAQFKLFYPFTEARGLAPMTFRDANGKTVTADDFKGRFVLLHFWATWCAPCARELPLLDRFQTEIAGKKLVILPVSADFDMPAAKISEFMKKNNANNLPVLVGVQNDGLWQVVSSGLPASFILGPDGRILYKMIGEADWTSEPARLFFDNLLNQRLIVEKNKGI